MKRYESALHCTKICKNDFAYSAEAPILWPPIYG